MDPWGSAQLDPWSDLPKGLRHEIEQALPDWKRNGRSSLPFFKALAKKKLGHLAVSMLLLLRDQRVELSAHHVSIAMGAVGDWQLALHLLNSAEKETVDAVVYNSTINVCKLAGQWQAALGLLHHMSCQRIANARSCSATISACEKANDWESALSLLDSMEEFLVQPEIFSYTAAMQASASAALWMTSLSLFESLANKGIVAAEVTYNTMLTACGNGSQWQKALEILDIAIQRKACSAMTYNVASFACGEAGVWEFSSLLVWDMQHQRVPPDGSTFNTAITSCGRNSQWQQALDLFRAADRMRDKVTFAAAIAACDMGAQWQAANLLLQEAISSRLLALQSFTSAISACGGQWQLAVHLCSSMSQLMVQQGFKSYGAAISACCQADRWDIGLAFLTKMLEESVTPGGCHVGSLAESVTRTEGPEVTYALLLHFRHLWQARSLMKAEPGASQLSDIPGTKILQKGCYIIALEKPAGIRTESLLQNFQYALKRRGCSQPCSLVSRLDLPTSGVLPIVLDHEASPAAAWYQSCFAGRLVSKDYLCLCEGDSLGPVGTQATISIPLITQQLPDGGIRAVASKDGRIAKTEYEVLRRFHSERKQEELILLQVHPVTGRTHQIRVHLAELGRPLVGDATYGRSNSSCSSARLFLHCHKVSMPDFAGQGLFSVVADLPQDLEELLSTLHEKKRKVQAQSQDRGDLNQTKICKLQVAKGASSKVSPL